MVAKVCRCISPFGEQCIKKTTNENQICKGCETQCKGNGRTLARKSK